MTQGARASMSSGSTVRAPAGSARSNRRICGGLRFCSTPTRSGKRGGPEQRAIAGPRAFNGLCDDEAMPLICPDVSSIGPTRPSRQLPGTLHGVVFDILLGEPPRRGMAAGILLEAARRWRDLRRGGRLCSFDHGAERASISGRSVQPLADRQEVESAGASRRRIRAAPRDRRRSDPGMRPQFGDGRALNRGRPSGWIAERRYRSICWRGSFCQRQAWISTSRNRV